MKIDSQGKILREIDQKDPTIIEEHKLTPDMIDDLTSLVPTLGDRQMSKVSIYKNFPIELPVETEQTLKP